MGLLFETLRNAEFLAGSREDAVREFMLLGRCRDVARGHVFWHAGDPPTDLVLPVSGSAKAVGRSADGRELIHELVGPGECIGLAATLDGLPHPHDAESTTGGEFFLVTRPDVRAFLDEHPTARTAAMRMLGRLYRQSIHDLEDVVFHHAAERVAKFLLDHTCVLHGDGARVLLDGNRAEIAARLAMAPEVVSRVTASLCERGLIRHTRRATFVTDWERLAEVAGTDSDCDPGAARGLDPDAAMRTTRHFLPLTDRVHRHELSREVEICAEHPCDLARCRATGCLVAFAAFRSPGATAPGRTGVPIPA
jgi:CRP-like cAMP-binding protein